MGRVPGAALRDAQCVASLAAGRHTDRTDATRLLAIGIAAFALAYLGFACDADSPSALLPWFVLAGIGIGCAETAEHSAVATHAPTDLRGSAFGLLAGVQSVGNLAASTIAGLVWTAFGPSWAFAYLANCMALALGGLVIASQPGDPGLDTSN